MMCIPQKSDIRTCAIVCAVNCCAACLVRPNTNSDTGRMLAVSQRSDEMCVLGCALNRVCHPVNGDAALPFEPLAAEAAGRGKNNIIVCSRQAHPAEGHSGRGTLLHAGCDDESQLGLWRVDEGAVARGKSRRRRRDDARELASRGGAPTPQWRLLGRRPFEG